MTEASTGTWRPEIVASGLDLPEGPFLDAAGTLHVVEVGGGFVTAVDVRSGRTERRFDTGGGPNGAAIGPDGAIYVSNNGGVRRSGDVVDVEAEHGPGLIQRCDPGTREVSVVLRRTDEVALSGPNDIAFDAAGRMWFTDPGHGDLKTPRGVLYRAAADGSEARVVARDYQYCNGLAFRPDGSLLVAETGSRTVWVHDGTGDDPAVREPFARLPRGMGPDGLCLDSAGNLIVAAAFGGLVLVYDADGSLVEQIPVPDRLVTSVAFGGPDRRDLFITLTATGLIATLEWPVPGLAVPGWPAADSR